MRRRPIAPTIVKNDPSRIRIQLAISTTSVTVALLVDVVGEIAVAEEFQDGEGADRG